MTTLQCTTCWETKWVRGTVAPSRLPLLNMSKAMWPWWCSVQILRTAKKDSFSPTKVANVARHRKWGTETQIWFGIEDTRHILVSLVIQSYPETTVSAVRAFDY